MKRDAENLLTYVVLLGFLALSVFAARFGWGGYAWCIGLLIAATKVAFIARNFMEVKGASASVRVAAAIGIVWFGVLLALALPDYLTRNGPPSIWPQAPIAPEISDVRARPR